MATAPPSLLFDALLRELTPSARDEAQRVVGWKAVSDNSQLALEVGCLREIAHEGGYALATAASDAAPPWRPLIDALASGGDRSVSLEDVEEWRVALAEALVAEGAALEAEVAAWQAALTAACGGRKSGAPPASALADDSGAIAATTARSRRREAAPGPSDALPLPGAPPVELVRLQPLPDLGSTVAQQPALTRQPSGDSDGASPSAAATAPDGSSSVAPGQPTAAARTGRIRRPSGVWTPRRLPPVESEAAGGRASAGGATAQ